MALDEMHAIANYTISPQASRAHLLLEAPYGARLRDGAHVTAAKVQQTLSELVAGLPDRVGPTGPGADKFSLAGRILADLTTGADFAEFLTTVAYDYLD